MFRILHTRNAMKLLNCHAFIIAFDLTRFQRVVPPFQSENHIKLVEDPVESKVDRSVTLFHRLFKSIL